MAYKIKIIRRKMKSFIVDFDSIKSINKAEKEKARLENQGYIQRVTLSRGLNKFRVIYTKEK